MATACYTPGYLRASFRGVEFHALDVSSEHGRRGAEGEFPFGETTAYADLGIKIRHYRISGQLRENTHIRDTAALIAACEFPGPGLLIHPTRGALTVACSRISVQDNPETSGGVTEVELEFVEANVLGSGFLLSGMLGSVAMTAITAAISGSISRNYSPATVRWYQAAQATGAGQAAIAQIRDQYALATASATTDETWRTIADFNAIVNDPFILQDPDTFTKALTNGMTYLESVTSGAQKATAFRSLMNWGAKVSSLVGEAAQTENAVYSAVRILAAGYVTRGLLEQPTTTLDAALTDYDRITAVLQEEAIIANTECHDPALYLAIRDFLVQVQTQLLQRAYDLPALVVYKFTGGTHSLKAAYEIYGDARRFADLESRNPQYLPWAFGPEVVAAGA
jgi:prophage DNA circulation protein